MLVWCCRRIRSVITFGTYNGYTKQEAIARYKAELRQKLGVKRLPFSFREVED